MNEVKWNDYIPSQDPFEDFIERYLHLNGFGRKFKLIKGNVAEEGSLNFKEKVDNLNLKKIGGDFLRIVTYILLFPVPIICLGIREWNRSKKNINLNPLKDTFEDQKYKHLVQENIGGGQNPPQLPTSTKEEAANAIVAKLKTIDNEYHFKNYEDFKSCFLNHDAAASKAMQKWVETLTNTESTTDSYEMHFITLKFLESKKCTIKEDKRLAYIAKINNHLKDIIEKASNAPEEERKETIINFLNSILREVPKDKKEERKEIIIVLNIIESIWDFFPKFWEENIAILEEIEINPDSDKIHENTENSAEIIKQFNEEKKNFDATLQSLLTIPECPNSEKLKLMRGIFDQNRFILFPLIKRYSAEICEKKFEGIELQLVLLHYLHLKDDNNIIKNKEELISVLKNSLTDLLQTLSIASEEDRTNAMLRLLKSCPNENDEIKKFTLNCSSIKYLLDCNPQFWFENIDLITNIRDDQVQYNEYNSKAEFIIKFIKTEKEIDDIYKNLLKINSDSNAEKYNKLREHLSNNKDLTLNVLTKYTGSICAKNSKIPIEMHLITLHFLSSNDCVSQFHYGQNYKYELWNNIENHLKKKLIHFTSNNQIDEIFRLINSVNPLGAERDKISEELRTQEAELSNTFMKTLFYLSIPAWAKNYAALSLKKNEPSTKSNAISIYNADLFLHTIENELVGKLLMIGGFPIDKFMHRMKLLSLFKPIAPELLDKAVSEICKKINSHSQYIHLDLFLLNLLFSEEIDEIITYEVGDEYINLILETLENQLNNSSTEKPYWIFRFLSTLALNKLHYQFEENKEMVYDLLECLWDCSPNYWKNNLDHIKNIAKTNFKEEWQSIDHVIEFIEDKIKNESDTED